MTWDTYMNIIRVDASKNSENFRSIKKSLPVWDKKLS